MARSRTKHLHEALAKASSTEVLPRTTISILKGRKHLGSVGRSLVEFVRRYSGIERRAEEAKAKKLAHAIRRGDVSFVTTHMDKSLSLGHVHGLLSLAVSHKNVGIVFALLETLDEMAASYALGCAASDSWIEGMSAVLGAFRVDSRSPGPFTSAITSGDLAPVRLLLEAGMSPNVGYPGFLNPMDFALREGRQEVVELLASYGAEPSGNISRYEMAEQEAFGRSLAPRHRMKTD